MIPSGFIPADALYERQAAVLCRYASVPGTLWYAEYSQPLNLLCSVSSRNAYRENAMDMKVPGDRNALTLVANEEFLLEEGLEVLASYRSIGDEGVRRAVRELIASLSSANVGAVLN